MKKQEASANTRDKNLLILLGVVILLFILYYFLLSPALDKAGQLKMEQEAVRTELQTAQTTVEQLPANRKEASAKLDALTEKYKQFFYEINQERLLYQLDTLINATDLPVNSYSQTKAVAKAIEEPDVVYAPLKYLLLEQAAVVNEKLAQALRLGTSGSGTIAASEGPAKDQVAVSYISLGFAGATYESFFNFLGAIEKLDRGIIIENFSIGNGGTGTALRGQLVLGIYSLAKPDEKESGDIEFTPVSPKGRLNPF